MAQPLKLVPPTEILNPPALPTGASRELDDAALMPAIARGDQDAFEELYRRHSGKVRRTVARILRSPADVEEVVQDTFFYLWRRASRYRAERGSVLWWLRVIARSRAIDMVRTHSVRQRALDRYLETPRPDAEPSPLAHALDRERASHLGQGLESLPEKQRRMLQLCYLNGATQSEAARASGLPLGTVKTRCFLGLQKMRRTLESDSRSLVC